MVRLWLIATFLLPALPMRAQEEPFISVKVAAARAAATKAPKKGKVAPKKVKPAKDKKAAPTVAKVQPAVVKTTPTVVTAEPPPPPSSAVPLTPITPRNP